MSTGAVPGGTGLLTGGMWTSPTDHTFIWINGVPWNAYDASLWGPGQPDDAGGVESVVELFLFGAVAGSTSVSFCT